MKEILHQMSHNFCGKCLTVICFLDGNIHGVKSPRRPPLPKKEQKIVFKKQVYRLVVVREMSLNLLKL